MIGDIRDGLDRGAGYNVHIIVSSWLWYCDYLFPVLIVLFFSGFNASIYWDFEWIKISQYKFCWFWYVHQLYSVWTTHIYQFLSDSNTVYEVMTKVTHLVVYSPPCPVLFVVQAPPDMKVPLGGGGSGTTHASRASLTGRLSSLLKFYNVGLAMLIQSVPFSLIHPE